MNPKMYLPFKTILTLKSQNALHTGMKDLVEFCGDKYRAGEFPSVSGNCSARGMAKLASIMSYKDNFNFAEKTL